MRLRAGCGTAGRNAEITCKNYSTEDEEQEAGPRACVGPATRVAVKKPANSQHDSQGTQAERATAMYLKTFGGCVLLNSATLLSTSCCGEPPVRGQRSEHVLHRETRQTCLP